MAQLQKPDPKLFALDTRPLHLRIEEAMESMLQGYSPGDQIPSEAQLAQLMSVSRNTIREVLRALEERGRIVRRHGKGTFIAPSLPVYESGLEVLESLDDSVLRMGVACQTMGLTICRELADATIAARLQVEIGTLVTVLTRTRVIGDTVIAYMYDVIPVSIASPEDLRPEFSGSVLDYFKRKGPYPSYAVTNLLSVQADKDLAEHLQVSVGTALLLLEEALFSVDNIQINYSHNYYNTSHFRYHIVRRNASNASGPITGAERD
jgi:GntR family transcriptional regulator